jgi:flagellum-specific peptidoglycan hydrolase FlgJ
MKYQNWITKGKHYAGKNLHLAKKWYENKWIRGAVIILGLTILLFKNINLSINLANPVHVEQTANNEEKKQSVKLQNEEKPKKIEEKKTVKQPKKLANSLFNMDSIPRHLSKYRTSTKDTTLANTFSNLGFLLNPGLAKRLKIDAKVVALKNKKCLNYIKEFSPIAQKEMTSFGIPASVTLAQGLLESNVGDSKLARRNNNHFGIKCFSRNCKKGHCSNYTDDSHKDFFRVYPSAWESYREHSSFLQKPRYKHLKKLGTKDYKNWAHGLRKAGYATDKKYGFKLIKIIEALNLDRFDK